MLNQVLTKRDMGRKHRRASTGPKVARIQVNNSNEISVSRCSNRIRLRDADHLKVEVHNLLDDVKSALGASVAIVKGERTPWDQETMSDSNSDTSSDMDGTLLGDTELKQLFEKVKSTLTSLFRLS